MPPRSFPSRWRESRSRAVLPAQLRPWLTDQASLTARIRAHCDEFSVRVLHQRSDVVLADEGGLLGLRRNQRTLVREVLLRADGVPVVFARSVLPEAGPRGAWRLLRGIGDRPLGAALFADPCIERCALTVAVLDRRDARYHRAIGAGAIMGAPRRLWARRSIFRQDGQPLLVTEVFLPAIRDFIR